MREKIQPDLLSATAAVGRQNILFLRGKWNTVFSVILLPNNIHVYDPHTLFPRPLPLAHCPLQFPRPPPLSVSPPPVHPPFIERNTEYFKETSTLGSPHPTMMPHDYFFQAQHWRHVWNLISNDLQKSTNSPFAVETGDKKKNDISMKLCVFFFWYFLCAKFLWKKKKYICNSLDISVHR